MYCGAGVVSVSPGRGSGSASIYKQNGRSGGTHSNRTHRQHAINHLRARGRAQGPARPLAALAESAHMAPVRRAHTHITKAHIITTQRHTLDATRTSPVSSVSSRLFAPFLSLTSHHPLKTSSRMSDRGCDYHSIIITVVVLIFSPPSSLSPPPPSSSLFYLSNASACGQS